MELALREAMRAYEEDEVPVGAIVACGERLVAKGRNMVERLADPTAHAEMIAISAAAGELGEKRLTECVLYVTLEPCPMCAMAAVLARFERLVYAAPDPKTGACGSIMNVAQCPALNHRLTITHGILADEAGTLLREFFRKRRIVKN